ncbi:MAG TPA: MauE/DoxX family redox-associated membrane protein [Thermoanaerobaculia bacterium]|nr:MauE/DoxX family redox-associated membrane protein [Thermoanaerobaculia bacterium]
MESIRQPSLRPARWWIGTLAGIFLGLVLLLAAGAKALDPRAFAAQIHAQKLDVLVSPNTLALAVVALEVGLGLALVLGVRRLWVLVPAVLLVAFFLFLTGRDYWRTAHGVVPEAAGCGCFGNLVQRSPAEAFWEDLALLVPALLLSFVGRGAAGSDPTPPAGRRGAFPVVRTAIVLALTGAATLFAWKAPDLPLDDLATRLRPGTEIAGICAGAGENRVCMDSIASELQHGRHLVVLADLDDPAFQRSVGALNAYASGGQGPTLWVISAATPQQHQSFYWRFGPTFQMREAPAALLQPLYRRLPRGFAVEEGRVTHTYTGLPPLPPSTAADPA